MTERQCLREDDDIGARDDATKVRNSVFADLLRYAPDELSSISSALILLMTALAHYDGVTYVHSIQVARRAVQIAVGLGLDAGQICHAYIAGLLHDIGMTTVRRSLLQKSSPLTAAEWCIIRGHPAAGERIIRQHADLREIGPLVLAHHERPDGLGYPAGLTHAEIPVVAKVLSVSEAIAAMASRRPYDDALSPAAICAELRVGAGALWDSEVVAVALRLVHTGS